MTLQQIKYVIGIAETGSLNKAAEKLFVSQPSLTSTIHDLEDELGAHRVDQLEQTGHQEYDAYQQGGETAEPLIRVSHGRYGSILARTRSKIASGGSILPFLSAQSILRKWESLTVSPR